MSEAGEVVPDGDPCPKHGLPSRLLWNPTTGLYNQCRECINDFLDWFGGHTKDVVRNEAVVPPPPRPVLRAKPEPAQIGLEL